MRPIIYTTLLLLLALNQAFVSTIGIATGSATNDGRPLLFKNKDRTDSYPSDVNYYKSAGDDYSYVFQQNDGQDHTRARMGINTAGFGIVYSDSENLTGAESGPTGSEFAAIALKTCASLDDFRALLASTSGERRVHNHYGVIDSLGQGALFEVDGNSHVELVITDSAASMANTAKYHPRAGEPAAGSTSPEREARANYLLQHAPDSGLSYAYLVDEVIKDFAHSQQDEDQMPLGQYFTNPVLSRYKTAAGCVIKGVLPQDNAGSDAIMWLCLSEPSLTVALPFFAAAADIPANIRATAQDKGMAGSSDQIRRLVYSYNNGRYGDRYADTFRLVKIREQTFEIQDSLFTAYEANRPLWQAMNNADAAAAKENWMADIHTWAKTEYDHIYSLMPLPESSGSVPDHIHVFPVYPNPFNKTTQISFYLNRRADVHLFVCDILGRKIRENRRYGIPAGLHTWRSTLSDKMAGGVYFLTIITHEQRFTQKLVYLP